MMYAPATRRAPPRASRARCGRPRARASAPLPGGLHARAHVVGDLHARHLVVQELGVLVAREREDADEHREAERRDVGEEALEHRGIVDRLRHDELGAGALLLREALELARRS